MLIARIIHGMFTLSFGRGAVFWKSAACLSGWEGQMHKYPR